MQKRVNVIKLPIAMMQAVAREKKFYQLIKHIYFAYHTLQK